MPAATTHAEFAREWKDSLPLEDQKRIRNENMFYLGSQGPDLFFFSDAGIGTQTLRRYGSLMHHQSSEKTLQFMRRYAGSDPDLVSYIYGYISHYALDSCAHPLIFHDARYMGNPKDTETVRHFRIEAMIDRVVLQKRNRTIEDYNVHILTALNSRDIQKLSAMYESLFKEVFHWKISRRKIAQTCRQCSSILKALRPNSIRKYHRIESAESFVHAPHLVSSLMLYNRFDNEDELLNLQHSRFENLRSPGISSDASFFDCWQQAMKKASALVSTPGDESLYAYTYEGALQK